MANGDSAWHDAVPWWAKTIVFLGGALVVPTLVAGYFMARDAGIISGPAARAEIAVTRVENSITEAVKDMKDAVNKRDAAFEKMLHVQVQTCRNSAKTESQTRDCDYWRSSRP